MDLQTVKKLRQFHEKYEIVIDDSSRYRNDLDGNRIVWDDENQVFYSIRTNVSHHLSITKPIEIISVDYDRIMYFRTPTDVKKLKSVLSEFESRNLIDSEAHNLILQQFE